MDNVNRNIGLERLFVLGQFRNLKVNDEINNIPPEIAFNPDAMVLLRKLQILQTDLVYLDYVKDSVTMQEELLNASPAEIEKVIEKVEASRVTALENLFEAVASVKNTEEETEDK